MRKLKDIREDAGLTQPELYARSGVAISTIWRAETGTTISRIKALAICKALNIQLEDVEEFQVHVRNPQLQVETGEHEAVSPPIEQEER